MTYTCPDPPTTLREAVDRFYHGPKLFSEEELDLKIIECVEYRNSLDLQTKVIADKHEESPSCVYVLNDGRILLTGRRCTRLLTKVESLAAATEWLNKATHRQLREKKQLQRNVDTLAKVYNLVHSLKDTKDVFGAAPYYILYDGQETVCETAEEAKRVISDTLEGCSGPCSFEPFYTVGCRGTFYRFRRDTHGN